MDLVIYNNLTRRREVFEPLEAGKVRLYACGVTTYDLCHIGHGMQAIGPALARCGKPSRRRPSAASNT